MLVSVVLTLGSWASLAATTHAAVATDAPGTISTVAGDGGSATVGNGGPATSAGMQEPYGVGADAAGDIMIADTESSEVRLVAGKGCSSGCPFGLGAMTKGDIYVLAGTGTGGYSGDGGPARSARIFAPVGVAADPYGDVLIADNGNSLIRLVARAACASACPYGLKSMIAGDIYTIAGDLSSGTPGNGVPATSAGFSGPQQLAVDQAGICSSEIWETIGWPWWLTSTA